MSRLMSVSLTEQAVRERRKTVTRRLGWRFLKAGDHLTLCRKVMGRKPGEPLVRICGVEVVEVRREPLHAIRLGDVAAEGFTNHTPEWFVAFFCEHMKCEPSTEVTRIEWRYLDDPLAICEWCLAPVADPYAPCDRDDCRAKTSQLDAAIAVAVAEELDD